MGILDTSSVGKGCGVVKPKNNYIQNGNANDTCIPTKTCITVLNLRLVAQVVQLRNPFEVICCKNCPLCVGDFPMKTCQHLDLPRKSPLILCHPPAFLLLPRDHICIRKSSGGQLQLKPGLLMARMSWELLEKTDLLLFVIKNTRGNDGISWWFNGTSQ